MNRLIVFASLVSFIGLNADSIDEIVSKINSKRDTTIPKDKLVTIASPMPKLVVVENNTSDENTTIAKAKVESFNLTAIMNSSAHINGEWIKVGDKVGSYRLVDVMDDSVYLKDGNKTKLIFFKQNSGKIKIRIGK